MSAASVRLDAWVWAVRMAKTRTAATDAVKAGRVKLEGAAAKPSAKVSVGDRVEVRRGTWRLEVEVVELRSKRVGAPLAEASYRVIAEDRPERGPTAAWAVRERGAGRPTKRDRRRLDQWRRDLGEG
ncbi:MAG: S4 domain-containing protein [Microthrixaceae bacterium]|nr:RNA-binding S4 domain-containing protein [Microthrixaceae bacterium]